MSGGVEVPGPGPRRGESPLGSLWRERTEDAQHAALPSGEVVVSCSAPLGAGGLGRHLQEILQALERDGRAAECICGSPLGTPSRPAARHVLGIPHLITVLRATGLPTSLGRRTRAAMVEFDAFAAERLPPAEHLIAFNSQALTQFRAARRAGFQSLSLVSANSHLRRLLRQHTLAHQQYPLEGSWAGCLLERNIAEYGQADRIYAASAYIRDSFLEEGFAGDLISDFPLTPSPRYEGLAREPSSRFEIVYIGSLAVHKGVPLLIDAVRRLAHLDIALVLVGGWGTRGMRRFVQRACAEDPRISVHPGDPLPHLRTARLCVHPAYEDGFAYAPAEALAANVPVIVSEDTGMKDLIDSSRDGVIVPTGDLDALTETIEAAYRGELLGASSGAA